MSEQNKALVRRWFDEVWNRGNGDVISELFAGVCYGFPDVASAIGPEAFRAAHVNFFDSFSEVHVVLDEVIAEGESVAVRFTCTMRHTGHGLGFAPTDQPVTLRGAALSHIRDGRIVEGWNYFDLAGAIARLDAFSKASQVSQAHQPDRAA